MSKFYGEVGYAERYEKSPGVWRDRLVTRNHFGDVIRNNRRLQSSDSVNDDINVSVKISIVSNPYSDMHFHSIRYVKFMGAKWKVTDVDPQPPRLILTLGGVYNGE